MKSNILIVAELSANHHGSIDIAIETIKAAKRCGADAVKLQTYTADTMTINSRLPDFTIDNNSIWDGQNFYSLYEKAHTPWEWHKKLFEVAKKEGLICFSTPFDRTSVDFLEKLNNPIYKIASFEITDLDLIEYVSSKGKPVILSTGIADKKDIEMAVDTVRSTGNNKITILKCTSSYPSSMEDSNLSMIPQIKKDFKVDVGISDHTTGIIAPVVAVAHGAKIIEKHFILDKNNGGPDSSFSLEPNEFHEMVSAVRAAELSIGKKDYVLTKKQISGKAFSRSLYIVENVKKGDIITRKNVRSIRPGFGLSPIYLKSILGKKFTSNSSRGTRLTWESIEGID
ncbi:MAG: pseudaminic acid synthase [Flavobacteriaceae bacterium]|tara:strand:- start:9732 stop:10754 length:1023 start_codon:yes stop_codon:yes gene_type:complete